MKDHPTPGVKMTFPIHPQRFQLQQLQAISDQISSKFLNDRLMLEYFYTMSKHQYRDKWFYHPDLSEFQTTLVMHDHTTRNPHIIDFALSIMKHCPKEALPEKINLPKKKTTFRKVVTKTTPRKQPVSDEFQMSDELISFIRELTLIYKDLEQICKNIQHYFDIASAKVFSDKVHLHQIQLQALYQLYFDSVELTHFLTTCPFTCLASKKLSDRCLNIKTEITLSFILNHKKYYDMSGVHLQVAELHLETWKEWQLMSSLEKQTYLKHHRELYSGWANLNQILDDKLDILIDTTQRLNHFKQSKKALSQFFINGIQHLNLTIFQITHQLKHLELHIREKIHELRQLIHKLDSPTNTLQQITLSLPENFYEILNHIQFNIPAIISLNNQKKLSELTQVIQKTLACIKNHLKNSNSSFIQPQKIMSEIRRFLQEIIESSMNLIKI